MQFALVLLWSLSCAFSTKGLNLDKFYEKYFKKWETKLSEKKLHEDFGLDIDEFLEKYNYPLEIHKVTTEDGYILTMHRIPHGRNELSFSNSNISKPAILFQHGLLSSSMEWVNMGPGRATALVLADEGYDIWLGNNRGNRWSRKHVSLDPDVNPNFWYFSFDDCAMYDLPAEIDYILNVTGHKKISYVGLSQGTTQFIAMAALRPDYNKKLTLATMLAPVVYMGDITQPIIKLASENLALLKVLLSVLNGQEIFPYNKIYRNITKLFLFEGSPILELVAQGILFFAGYGSPQLDRNFISVMTSNFPSGASLKMFVHYGQEIESGKFRRYDYGLLGNLKYYGQLIPPNYNLSQITAPVALFYGANDYLSPLAGVERLKNELPNIAVAHLMEEKLWNHIDFHFAKDIKSMLDNYLVYWINKYNGR